MLVDKWHMIKLTQNIKYASSLSYCCVKIEGKDAEVQAVCSLSLLFCAVQAAVVGT